jgi:hypothetical protein
MSKQKYLKIDFEILQCLELSWQEKVVYAEIVHLDKIGGCTASQKHFCDLLNIKKDVCSRVFKKLQEKGFVLKNKKQYFPLKFVDQKSTNELIKSQPEVDQKSTGVDQKSTEHHIYKEKKENREEEEIENLEEEKPDPEFLKQGKQQRQMSHEMYEVLQKKQPEIHGGIAITPDDVDSFRSIKTKIKVRQKALNKQSGNPYKNVSDDDILSYWKNMIKFIPPYMLEKSRLNPAHINRNFDKLVKEVRAEYLKGRKNNKPEKYDIYVRDKKPKR